MTVLYMLLALWMWTLLGFAVLAVLAVLSGRLERVAGGGAIFALLLWPVVLLRVLWSEVADHRNRRRALREPGHAS